MFARTTWRTSLLIDAAFPWYYDLSMEAKRRARVLSLVVAAWCLLGLSCTIIPTIGKTHLYDDIREKTLSVTAATEIPIGEGGSVLPDPLYEYVSYAPTDWLEFGIAGHWGLGALGGEVKIDIIDIFANAPPFSLLIVGGVLAIPGSESGGAGVTVGVCANYRLGQRVEFYLGAGSSTVSQVPSVQLGANVHLLKWLALSANAKVVFNTRESDTEHPVVLMVSLAPSLNFHLAKTD